VMTDLPRVTESLTSCNAQRVFAEMNSKGAGALPQPITEPRVMPLDWTDWNSFEGLWPTGIIPFDIVLLTDCVFSAALAEPLVSCIRRLSGVHTVVYCCHEIRDEEANEYFLAEFRKYFTVKRIPRHKLHPEYANELIQLVVGKPIRVSKKTSKT
jgi:Lysine methyltransferase